MVLSRIRLEPFVGKTLGSSNPSFIQVDASRLSASAAGAAGRFIPQFLLRLDRYYSNAHPQTRAIFSYPAVTDGYSITAIITVRLTRRKPGVQCSG